MSADIVSMIINVSQSLVQVQSVIIGAGYLIGILLMMTAIGKLRKIGDARARGGGQEKMFIPFAYFLGGSALIFLPSAVSMLSNTAFGTGNILQYTPFKLMDAYSAVKIIIQTAGLLWFVRGCVLLVHASEPGVQHGPKGLAFIVAGILAMNFESTIGVLNYVVVQLLNYTLFSTPKK